MGGGLLSSLAGGRLWRHPDFLKLWTGQSLSQFGTAVTQLALPTAAILLLHAGPVQIGVLGALEFLAFPTLGLFVGVWADRLRRRPIMIVCDSVRMLALGSVPAAWLLGSLTIGQLYVVAALTGVGSVFFDVAYQSYLPALVDREDLLEGNSKLEVTRSLAQVVGPGLAGLLIQFFKAANAILADSISYLISVLTLLWIRKPEPEPMPAAERPGFFREMGEGIQVVFGHRMIRLIAGCTATSNLFGNIGFTVVIIWMYRQVHLSPGQVGLIFSLGSIGAVIGSVIAFPVAQRIGMGVTLLLTTFLGSAVGLLQPLAGTTSIAVGLLALIAFFMSATGPIYNINQVSYRQAAIPVHLQGRLNATVRTFIWGTIPIGSALGGVLGSAIGLVPTIYLGFGLSCLSALWILAGPVRIKGQPEPAPS